MKQQLVKTLEVTLDGDLFSNMLSLFEEYWITEKDFICIPVEQLKYLEINFLGENLEIVVRDFQYIIIKRA